MQQFHGHWLLQWLNTADFGQLAASTQIDVLCIFMVNWFESRGRQCMLYFKDHPLRLFPDNLQMYDSSNHTNWLISIRWWDKLRQNANSTQGFASLKRLVKTLYVYWCFLNCLQMVEILNASPVARNKITRNLFKYISGHLCMTRIVMSVWRALHRPLGPPLLLS